MSRLPSPIKAEDLLPETLYSTLHRFATLSASTSSLSYAPHPFGSSDQANATQEIRDLLTTAERVSFALNAHYGQHYADAKLVSLLKQHASISHALHQADAGVQHITDTLKAQVKSRHYGADVPDDRSTLPTWFISQLEAWAVSAGMEVFKDEQIGHTAVTLAGKILVLDIDIAIDRTLPDTPGTSIAGVKTSYAVTSGSDGPSTKSGSLSLAGFVSDGLKAYLKEVQQGGEERDVLVVEALGLRLRQSLEYLTRLDELSAAEGDTGLRWFTTMDELALLAEGHAAKEARQAASALSATEATLDTFVMRGHALPLHYLSFPSLSFLIHISPLAYLSLLRSSPSPSTNMSGTTTLPGVDVPFTTLRSRLSQPQPLLGTVLATLRLAPPDTVWPPAAQLLPTPTFRPSFPLDEGGAQDFALPQAFVEGATTPWVLDFTDGGRQRGVVMTQAAMHDVEHALNSMSGFELGAFRIGMSSWLDLLFQHVPAGMSPSYWTASYRSPSNTHPLLHLRLKAPSETGYILERVPVRSLREIWAVLEVVREQCWLNTQLTSLPWTPEGYPPSTNLPGPSTDAATLEAELATLLSGTYTPNYIPVTVSLTDLSTPTEPTAIPDEDDDMLFGGDVPGLGLTSASAPSSSRLRRALVMSAPTRAASGGAVEVYVTQDESRPWGVYVGVKRGPRVGAVVAGGDMEREERWEEVVRRGGVFGIPGRLWAA